MDATGSADSTAAVNAAIAALPAIGGTLIIPDPGTGYYKMNLIITKSGVTIIGPGGTPVRSTRGPRAIMPYDTNKPVIQFGNEAAYVTGSSIQGFNLNGDGSGKYGLRFAGGAYKCWATDIQIMDFTVEHLTFTNDDVVPCTFNKVYNLTTVSGGYGAVGVMFRDKHTGGAGWTTANDIIGFSLSHTMGFQVVCDSCSYGPGSITDGYLQCGVSGMSVLFKNTYGSGVGSLVMNNVAQDSFSSGNYKVGIVVEGFDAQTTGVTDCQAVSGEILSGGNIYYQAGTTTSTATCNSTALAVASATGIYPGRVLRLIGGSASVDHYATVASISGLNVVLSNAPPSSFASGITVGYGDVSGMECKGAPRNLMSGGINFNGLYGKSGFSSRNVPTMYQGAGVGPGAAWTDWGLILDLGNLSWNIFSQSKAASATWSQSGTTVTITLSSHGAKVGDYIEVAQGLSPGVNGTKVVASVTSTSVLTFTSTVSQTASGNCYVRVMKGATYSAGVFEFGGEVKLNNSVSASTSNTVTNKVKVVIGGVTYYLLASTSST